MAQTGLGAYLIIQPQRDISAAFEGESRATAKAAVRTRRWGAVLTDVGLALLLTGTTLNLFSMIGLVMLMGLVTKNAILLVDFANQARKAGATVADALLRS